MKNLLILLIPIIGLIACNRNATELMTNIQGSYLGTASMTESNKEYSEAKLVITEKAEPKDTSEEKDDDAWKEFSLYLKMGSETLVIPAEAESSKKFEIEDFIYMNKEYEGKGVLENNTLSFTAKNEEDSDDKITFKGVKTQ